MNVRPPKSYAQLPRREKENIKELIATEVEKQILHEEAELQKIWLQYACIVLHKNFGFGKRRCQLFLANWKEMYRINSQLDGKAKQSEYLSTELAKIFRKEGYPTAYVDKLENL